MQCYTELVPPSGVTDALALPFTSTRANNLIVARTSLLQIFYVKQTDHGQGAKLVLVAEYNLSGTITSLGRVKILNAKCGEAVLIAFRDAKLSLVEWDPERHTISTISIHYYETEALQRNPWVPDLRDCVNHLIVDPSSRCAVFHFGMTNVAIMPFHQLGDDLVMDDYDADLDQEDVEMSSTKKANGDRNGAASSSMTPYASSFVLPLTALEPAILHPVHLAFLYEYREPTFGIIFTTVARSSALSYERKDVTQYGVLTLDLEQRASTILLSISRLPNDLFAVIPLPLPVGGALLIGANELIHVDQGGKTNAVAVNEFARQLSSFSMVDQSSMGIRLEGSQVQQLNASTGDTLLILATGDLILLTFRLDGRSVSGMSVRMLPQDLSRTLFQSRASCVASLGNHNIFIGSEVADSVLLTSIKKPSQLKRHSSRGGLRSLGDAIGHVDEAGEEEEDIAEQDDDDDVEDDEDDLYGDVVGIETTGQAESTFTSGTSLRVLDRLSCIAPLQDLTMGRTNKRKREDDGTQEDRSAHIEVVAASGEGRAGGITIFNRQLFPKVISRRNVQRVNGVWSLSVSSVNISSDQLDSDKSYHDFMITSSLNEAGSPESTVYSLSSGTLEERICTDFDPSAGEVVEWGSIMKGAHIVQVLETQIRVYDRDFRLAQIMPIGDEENISSAKARIAAVVDPYILVVKDDNSLLLLRADKKGELDEVELDACLMETQCLSASLYKDSNRIFTPGTSDETGVSCILALLSSAGALSIYALSDTQARLFHYDGAAFLPPVLADSTPPPRHWKGAQALSEVLIADLGDNGHSHPHLLFRSSDNNIAIYDPFTVAPSSENGSQLAVCFRKIPVRWTPKTEPQSTESNGEVLNKTIRYFKTAFLGDLLVVLLAGNAPAIIARRAACSPRIYHLAVGTISAVTGCHTPWCPSGVTYIDEKQNLCTTKVAPEVSIGQSNWLQRKVELGVSVTGITYFDRTQSYVLATSSLADFQLPQDDEWHMEWRNETTACLPQVEHGCIQLLSLGTFRTIHGFQLEKAERAMCIQSMILEVSEETHEKKELIVVGTAITKGEDVVTRGAIYIFDIVDVVPQPGIPETDLKLKLIAKEEVKGAVTSVCPVGSQGFMLAAQGQKCMVRGLKEDLSILPVAFMDMQHYVGTVKELAGTGLCILGDAMNGLWFVGYSEEPYKLQLFGRDQQGLEVMAAEFLPDGQNLHILAAGGDGDLHLLQFDPESPGSERGMKLLHRSTFASGTSISTMTLLPSKIKSAKEDRLGPRENSPLQGSFGTPSHHILVTSQEGSVGLITSLAEQTYRRLSALQNTLTANLEHACGLNPRAYRAVETDGVGGAAIVDGNLVQMWLDQDMFHQESMADKVGSTAWEIKEDLQDISGGVLTGLRKIGVSER